MTSAYKQIDTEAQKYVQDWVRVRNILPLHEMFKKMYSSVLMKDLVLKDYPLLRIGKNDKV